MDTPFVIQNRPGGSLGARLAAVLTRLLVRPVFTLFPLTPGGITVVRRLTNVGLPPLRGTIIERVSFEGLRAEWVRARGTGDGGPVVLYFHGGGFVALGLRTYRRMLSRISRAAGAAVLSVDYRMLPRAALRGQVADCVTAYRWLLEQGHDPGRIVMAGDSSGGTLAYAVPLAVLAEGLPSPAAIVSLSPWLDFDCAGKQAHPNARRDSYIPVSRMQRVATMVCESRPYDEVSPVHAAPALLAQLPPSLLQAGGAEVLRLDAEMMAVRLAATGTPHQVQIWNDHIHVFQAFSDLIPEGRQAIEEIGRFVQATTAMATTPPAS